MTISITVLLSPPASAFAGRMAEPIKQKAGAIASAPCLVSVGAVARLIADHATSRNARQLGKVEIDSAAKPPPAQCVTHDRTVLSPCNIVKLGQDDAMPHQRPPQLGFDTLQQVVPVLQIQRHAPWTVVLVSIERWERGFVVKFDLHRNGPIAEADRALHPRLEISASDDNGLSYAGSPLGGYGGGRRNGELSYRLLYTFAPPLDPAAGEIRFSVVLQLVREEGGGPPGQVVARTEPGPWDFTVAMPSLGSR